MVEIESRFAIRYKTKIPKSKLSVIYQPLSSSISCKFEFEYKFEYKIIFIPPFRCISYIPYPSLEFDKILCDSVNRIEILSLPDRSI